MVELFKLLIISKKLCDTLCYSVVKRVLTQPHVIIVDRNYIIFI